MKNEKQNLMERHLVLHMKFQHAVALRYNVMQPAIKSIHSERLSSLQTVRHIFEHEKLEFNGDQRSDSQSERRMLAKRERHIAAVIPTFAYSIL